MQLQSTRVGDGKFSTIARRIADPPNRWMRPSRVSSRGVTGNRSQWTKRSQPGVKVPNLLADRRASAQTSQNRSVEARRKIVVRHGFSDEIVREELRCPVERNAHGNGIWNRRVHGRLRSDCKTKLARYGSPCLAQNSVCQFRCPSMFRNCDVIHPVLVSTASNYRSNTARLHCNQEYFSRLSCEAKPVKTTLVIE